MTTSRRRRGISPLLIAAAALLLGVLAYGFTAQATVTNGNNLAGGQGNVVGLAFQIETNSVTYSFIGGVPDSGGRVNEVSFNATPVTGASFSPNVQLFIRANLDSMTSYNACNLAPSNVITGNNQFARFNGNLIIANRCIFPALPVNSSTFGLDVIIVE
jgi:hypothetical protein